MDKQQKQSLIEKINTKAIASPVQDAIINDCYKFFFEDESQWKFYNEDPIYVIGLSEDRYDYYWVYIDNKERKIKFITCLFDIDKPCEYVTKTWNKQERKNIVNDVNEYFREHSDKENLIYLDEKLYI